MYDIEGMLNNTDLMLKQGMDLITDSMPHIIDDQKNGMAELQNTYEQLQKLINIEESI